MVRAARGLLAIGFAAAGLIAQMLYLGYWAANESVPLSSAYEWYLLAAAAVAATYLYLGIVYPSAASGVFILPLALALVAAAKFASKASLAQSPAARVWITIHMSFWLLGTIAVIVGFATGVMYLLQAHRLKKKLPPLAGLRLPSLEWLERANGRAIVISALMAGAGLASGIVLNMVKSQFPWSDPTIWRSVGFFAWLLAAALFNAIYRPAQRDARWRISPSRASCSWRSFSGPSCSASRSMRELRSGPEARGHGPGTFEVLSFPGSAWERAGSTALPCRRCHATTT